MPSPLSPLTEARDEWERAANYAHANALDFPLTSIAFLITAGDKLRNLLPPEC